MRIFAFERFDQNEWFLIIGVLILSGITYLLPKRLPSPITLLLFIWGFTIPKFYDFTFGGGLFDFYDINDSPRYCVMDLVSYVFYAPLAYLFIYIYDRLGIGSQTLLFYILAWSLVAIGVEWIEVLLKVVTYKNGYGIYDSFVIYLFTQSMTVIFYKWLIRSPRFKK